MTITLRTTDQAGATNKNAEMSHSELDGNFVDLLTNKIQPVSIEADSGTASTLGLAQGTGVLVVNGGTNINTTIASDSAGQAVLTITGTTFMANLTDDSSPQLSANLDVNGNSIVSASAGDINITPDGAGKVVIDGINYPQADGQAGDFLVTDGSNNLGFARLQGGTGITVTNPDSAGAYTITSTVSAGLTDIVNDSSPQLGGNLDVNGQDIVSTSAGNIDIQPDGNGKTNLKNITYNEKIHEISYNANFTPEPTDGPIQRMVLTGAVNFNGFATETEGATISIIFEQDGSGNRTFTDNVDSANRMLFAGGEKTLSTAGNSIDIMTITFASGTYFASLSKNFSA
tara:strand:+ start:109 stop:1140 length:1032 start_codon:yes stop_codon:yes gene_type:complete